MKTLAAFCVVILALCVASPQVRAESRAVHEYTVLTIPGASVPYGTAQINICKSLIRVGALPTTGPFPRLSVPDITALTNGKVTGRSVPVHTDPVAFCHDTANALENRRVPGHPGKPLTREAYFGLSSQLRSKADAGYKRTNDHQFVVLKSEHQRIAALSLFGTKPVPAPRPIRVFPPTPSDTASALLSETRETNRRLVAIETKVERVQGTVEALKSTVTAFEPALKQVAIAQESNTTTLSRLTSALDTRHNELVAAITATSSPFALRHMDWPERLLVLVLLLALIGLLGAAAYALGAFGRRSRSRENTPPESDVADIRMRLAAVHEQLETLSKTMTRAIEEQARTHENAARDLASVRQGLPFAPGYLYPFTVGGVAYTGRVVGYEQRAIGGPDLGLVMLLPIIESPFEDRQVDLLTLPNHVAVVKKRKT